MLSNAYFLAKFRFDTAENEPAKNLQNLPILLTLAPNHPSRVPPTFAAESRYCSVAAALFSPACELYANERAFAIVDVHFSPTKRRFSVIRLFFNSETKSMFIIPDCALPLC